MLWGKWIITKSFVQKRWRRLTHLDAIQHFIDQLDPGILEPHLFHLHLSTDTSHASVKRNHQYHDRKSSKDGRPHGEVEEDQGEDDLKRSWPEGVEVRSKVHESLSVHWHQVDYLSHCAGTTSLVAKTKSLKINNIINTSMNHFLSIL